MNRYLLTGAVILACICIIISIAYACVSLNIDAYYKECVKPGNTVYLHAWVYEGGPVSGWNWIWPSGFNITYADSDETDSYRQAYCNTVGLYEIGVEATGPNGYDSESTIVYVIDLEIENNPPNRDTPEYIAYQAGMNVYYKIEPASGWAPDEVKLYIKDVSSGSTFREMTLSNGVGEQTACWNGQNVRSQWAEAGQYTAQIRVRKYGSYIWSDPHTFYVIKADIDIDTNNNGLIEESEDLIEEYSPGAILPKNLEGDGENNDFRKEIQLAVEPILPNGEVILEREGDYGVVLWTASIGGTMKLLPYTYSPTELPSSMWVDGTVAGSKPYIRLRYKDSQGNTVAQDKVKVLVSETVSRSPLSSRGCVWLSLKNDSEQGDDWKYYDADTFVEEIEEQGYGISWLEDNYKTDSDFEGCTLNNYKNTLLDSGAIHVISHGKSGYHLAVYSTDYDACVDWIGDENNMTANYFPEEKCYTVYVSTAWLSDNSNLDDQEAIAHWAICYGTGIQNAAGGRWRVGYHAGTDAEDANNTTEQLFRRMNGKIGNGQYRTAGEAYADGSFSGNTHMSGNNWTTLFPAPMINDPVWPDSDPGQRLGWGCIIFDTYMDDSESATNALVCDSGGPISNQSWCGDTGYGKFILGFDYNNTGGGGAEIRADATYCKDEGEKQMDANRITPNENDPEGDDKEWEY